MRHDARPITMLVGADEPGVGAALAAMIASAGHHLCLVGSRRATVTPVAQSIKGAPSIRVLAGDYVRPRRVRHFVDDMLIHYGRVDNLVYVPIHHTFGDLLTAPDEELERQLQTAVWGPWWWLRSLIPTMASHDGGRLVFLAGAGGGPGPVGRPAFRAATAALHALVESAGVDHAADRVRPVTVLLDGFVDLPPEGPSRPDVHPDQLITIRQVTDTVHGLLTGPLGSVPHRVHVRPGP